MNYYESNLVRDLTNICFLHVLIDYSNITVIAMIENTKKLLKHLKFKYALKWS